MMREHTKEVDNRRLIIIPIAFSKIVIEYNLFKIILTLNTEQLNWLRLPNMLTSKCLDVDIKGKTLIFIIWLHTNQGSDQGFHFCVVGRIVTENLFSNIITDSNSILFLYFKTESSLKIFWTRFFLHRKTVWKRF